MYRPSKSHKTLALASSLSLVLAFVACSNKENTDPEGSGGATNSGGANSGGNAGHSGGGPASGGGTGDSGGSAGNSGGANQSSGGGSGDGSGGSGNEFSGVPGAEGFDCTPAVGDVPALKATAVVTSGLSQAMHVAYEPGGAAKRLFVLEREGVIRLIDDGALVATP